MCSGKESTFSLEDTVCGGLVLSRLVEYGEDPSVKLNDAAMAAQVLYEHYADDLLGMLQTSNHGQYLTEVGFKDDLATCAQLDTLDVVPVLVEDRIVKAKT